MTAADRDRQLRIYRALPGWCLAGELARLCEMAELAADVLAERGESFAPAAPALRIHPGRSGGLAIVPPTPEPEPVA